MTAQSKERLEQTIATYDLLASLFLTLPDEELVRSVLAGEFEDETGSAGLDEIARWGREQRDANPEDVLLDLARDRVVLMRGVNREGMQPPYESLYLGQKENTTIGSLNRFYGSCGYTLTDEVKDAPDQVGVEIAFAQLVLEQELAALADGNLEQATELEALYRSFLSQHLGRWASRYGTKMAKTATTGFYRGIGLLLVETFS